MKEIFKDIPDYEGLYQISNYANVKSLKVGSGTRGVLEKILKPSKNETGYLNIGLHKNKKQKTFKVHRLLMFAFKPDEYFEGAQVNHIDGNKLNNSLDNLEWCTPKENTQHADSTGLRNIKGEKHGKSKLTENQVRKIRSNYENKKFNQYELAKIFNIDPSTISDIVNNKRWNHI